jgi:hypothetical protein
MDFHDCRSQVHRVMKVEYRITEDDYAKAMQLHEWRRVLRWPSAIARATILILLILGAWWLPPDAAQIAAVCVVALAIAPAVRVYLVTHHARRMYRQYKGIQEPMTVELSDDGLRVGSVDGEAILPWRKILQWRQNDQFVLIYKMPMLFYLLPKSLARQGFDIRLLVQRLAERVGPER